MPAVIKKFNHKKPSHVVSLLALILLIVAIPLTVRLALKSEDPIKSPQAATTVPSGYAETPLVSGLSIPTAMEFAPDGRLFVSEKGGSLRVIKNGNLLSTPFLTVSVNTVSERGLLGIAFDPDFQNNRYIYVYYTRSSPVKNRVSRFRASATNPDIVEAGSETVLVDNIASDAGNHNAGAVHFGTDGKLYITAGDGGSVATNSQDLSNLSGKILRINKDGTIPSDNPFVGQSGQRGEIWAYGLRNPFTFAVDPATGKIFLNDVGAGAWEEVNDIQKGKNYGWPNCEGPQGSGVGSCNNSAFTYPIYSYPHSGSSAITGGTFYRGTQFPADFDGDYFFADYIQNFIRKLEPSNNQVTSFATGASNPVDLKIGPDGSLYYLDISDGTVYKIQKGAPTAVANANLTSGNAPLTVSFSGLGSTDPNGLALTYSWDFGDGAVGTGLLANHTYNSNGIFQAILTVTNSNNVSNNSSPISINVGNAGIISFNDRPTGILNGQYPTGIADWGSNKWLVGAAFASFPDNSIAFNGAGPTSATFTFVSPKRLLSVDISGVSNSTITISCAGNTTITRNVSANLLTTIQTGWNNNCTTVTIGSSNGWDTNFDNFVFDAGTGTPNLPPTATITAPADQTLYSAGGMINFSGSGTDPEDGTLAASAFSWTIVFHHDTHTHPFLDPPLNDGTKTGSLTIPKVGESSANVWYRVHLKVTDSKGLQNTTFVDVIPRKSTITINSSPAGLQVTLDGQPRTAPYSTDSVVGFTRILGAASNQTLAGKNYQFVSWSDAGAATHNIDTLASNTTYTATYQEIIPPQDTTAPVVTITNPLNGQTVIDRVNIQATATDDSGTVSSVEFNIDGARKFTDTASPYVYSWDTTIIGNGSHTILVKAFDAKPNEGSAQISVNVSNQPVGDIQKPSVPTVSTGQAISDSETKIAWKASTDNVGVKGYHIYRNNVRIQSVSSTSYTDIGLKSYTAYTYQVSAYDAAGNESARSSGVAVRTLKYADLNGDTKINIFDLSILLADWNTSDPNSNLDDKGKVNIFDLSILLSRWGK
ncbi:MAG: PQQ-dependent sugar dehydrogenase [Candidatus Woykebacteria bacterium]